MLEAAKQSAELGYRTEEAEMYINLFRMNMCMKSQTWKHEKEFRIIYPLGDDEGKNVSWSQLILKIRNIYAGFNCSEENKKALKQISNSLGLDKLLVINKGDEKDYFVGAEEYHG